MNEVMVNPGVLVTVPLTQDWPKTLDLGGVLVPVDAVRLVKATDGVCDDKTGQCCFTRVKIETVDGSIYYVDGPAAAQLWTMFSANTVFSVDWVQEEDRPGAEPRPDTPPSTAITHANGVYGRRRFESASEGWQ